MARIYRLLNEARNLSCARLRVCKRGQDLVEYALLAGFVALAAGATVPYVIAQPMQRIYEAAVNLLRASGG